MLLLFLTQIVVLLQKIMISDSKSVSDCVYTVVFVPVRKDKSERCDR